MRSFDWSCTLHSGYRCLEAPAISCKGELGGGGGGWGHRAQIRLVVGGPLGVQVLGGVHYLLQREALLADSLQGLEGCVLAGLGLLDPGLVSLHSQNPVI